MAAARLGHAGPAITLRVYAHVLPDQAMEAADVFARLPGRDPLVADPLARTRPGNTKPQFSP